MSEKAAQTIVMTIIMVIVLIVMFVVATFGFQIGRHQCTCEMVKNHECINK